MRRNWLVSMLTIAACGLLLAAGGAAAAAKGPAAAGGKANIMIYGVNTDGAYWHAIVSGVIGDYGPAVSIYPDGKIDPMHNSEMELRLTHGSFRLSIAALDKAFVKATSHEPTYPRTCSSFFHVTAAMPVIKGSGTGAYRGITGSFQVTATLNEVNPKPCAASTRFLWQVITLAGAGTVSV